MAELGTSETAELIRFPVRSFALASGGDVIPCWTFFGIIDHPRRSLVGTNDAVVVIAIGTLNHTSDRTSGRSRSCRRSRWRKKRGQRRYLLCLATVTSLVWIPQTGTRGLAESLTQPILRLVRATFSR